MAGLALHPVLPETPLPALPGMADVDQSLAGLADCEGEPAPLEPQPCPLPPRAATQIFVQPAAGDQSAPRAPDAAAWAVECQKRLSSELEALTRRYSQDVTALMDRSLLAAQAERATAGGEAPGAQLRQESRKPSGMRDGRPPAPPSPPEAGRKRPCSRTTSWMGKGAPPAENRKAPMASQGSVLDLSEETDQAADQADQAEGGGQKGGARGVAAAALDLTTSMKPNLSYGRARTKPKDKKKGYRKDTLLKGKNEELEMDRNALEQLVATKYFRCFSSALIASNAVFIGYQTEWTGQQSSESFRRGLAYLTPAPAHFTAVEIVFAALFIVELGSRWAAEGLLQFFRTDDIGWNILDTMVVVTSTFEVVFSMLVDSEEGSSVLGTISILRILRVVSMIRLAKVIRVVRFFRELRMMIMSILTSMKSLIWAMLILGLTFFVFGVAMTNGTATYLDAVMVEQGLLGMSAGEREKLNQLVRYFGTLMRSIKSLYMAMCGGKDWGDYYDVVEPAGLLMSFVFIFFISFSIFAVVNIVTGIFVDTAMQCNLQDREVIIQDELEKQKEVLTCIQSVFEDLDLDGTGYISKAEFEDHLGDERVVAYFDFLELDASDALTLFKLLDYDQSGEVELEEFVSGCLKLKGQSRSLDMAMLRMEVTWLHQAFLGFTAAVAPPEVAEPPPGDDDHLWC